MKIKQPDDTKQTPKKDSHMLIPTWLKYVLGIMGTLLVIGFGMKMFTPKSPKPNNHSTAMSSHSQTVSTSSSESTMDNKASQKIDVANKEAAEKQRAQAQEADKKIQAAKQKAAASHGHNSVDMVPIIKKGFTAYYTNPNADSAWPSARKKTVLKKIGNDITTQAMDQLISPTSIKGEHNMSLVPQPNLSEPLEITPTKGLAGYYTVTAKYKNYVNSGKDRHVLNEDTNKYIVVTNHNKITAISNTSN